MGCDFCERFLLTCWLVVPACDMPRHRGLSETLHHPAADTLQPKIACLWRKEHQELFFKSE